MLTSRLIVVLNILSQDSDSAPGIVSGNAYQALWRAALDMSPASPGNRHEDSQPGKSEGICSWGALECEERLRKREKEALEDICNYMGRSAWSPDNTELSQHPWLRNLHKHVSST